MIILFLFIFVCSICDSLLFAAASNDWLSPARKKTVQSGGFSPAPIASGVESPVRFIPYQCDQEEIIFDTQFLEITFQASECFQNRYSRNQNFDVLIKNLCHGLKKDQIKLLIKAIGENNEVISGRGHAANFFAQCVQEQDFAWLLKKTRKYGIDHVHSALITRIASEPNFVHTIADSCELTSSTYFAISKKIDRERLHKIISECLKEGVQLKQQHGPIKSVFFDKKDPAKMFLANSSGVALYDIKKRDIVQEFFIKDVRDDRFVCCDRGGNYCFELNDGQIFIWELQFRPARKSELKIERGVLHIGINSSDTQLFVQYKDRLLTYDIPTGESKEMQALEGSDLFKQDGNSYSVHYKDDDTLCIQKAGELCFYNSQTAEQKLIRLSLDRYQFKPRVVYNEQGTQALLAFSDKLFFYDLVAKKELEIRLPLKESESLMEMQFCDNDSKLLLHTGYKIHVYDLEDRNYIASYPIIPQYNKIMYKPEALIAVSYALSKFVVYPYLDLKALNSKQILLLFKASACWHINRKYGVEKEDHEVFCSLPEQIKSSYLFYYAQTED
jgi:hypothetical protein